MQVWHGVKPLSRIFLILAILISVLSLNGRSVMSEETGITLETGIILGGIAVGIAVVFGILEVISSGRNKKLTGRISEYQIDEKTAVLWRHARNVNNLEAKAIRYEMEEIKSTIRAAGRLEEYYSNEDKAAIRNALNSLVSELKPKFPSEAQEVENLFNSYFPPSSKHSE